MASKKVQEEFGNRLRQSISKGKIETDKVALAPDVFGSLASANLPRHVDLLE